MPIPTTVADLSTTASSNYPAGSESPNQLDDYLRAQASIIRQVSDAKADISHTQASSTISDSTAAGRAILTAADASAQRTALGLGTAATQASAAFASSGAVTSNGNTMATAKMLGRSTAATGAIEEIAIGSGLSLSAGTLSATGTVNQAQLAKAWVNFDGTLSGTITPRASYNVSSVTKNATGDYTINFTSAMADANYAISVTGSSNGIGSVIASSMINIATAPSKTAVRVGFTFGNTGTPGDPSRCSVIVFGN